MALLLVTCACSGLSGCSGFFSSRTTPMFAAQNWVADGSISLHRPLPRADTEIETGSVLAFAPSLTSNSDELWIDIKRTANSLAIMRGKEVLFSIAGEGFKDLAPGEYAVMHKQREPTWYAPNSYYETRALEVPAEHSKDRFLRGALGEYAVFLAPDLPLHCGPMWLADIGGARLSEQDMAQVYYRLEVGAPIRIE